MNKSLFSFLPSVILTTVVVPLWIDHASGQEVALTPIEATEVARGYRADALKLKPVINDKNETIGRISDYIFGKDGNIYVVLAVGDLAATSSLFPSVASNWTTPPATLCCRGQVARHWRNCRFS